MGINLVESKGSTKNQIFKGGENFVAKNWLGKRFTCYPSARREKSPRKSFDTEEDFDKINMLKQSVRVRFQLYGCKNFEKESIRKKSSGIN